MFSAKIGMAKYNERLKFNTANSIFPVAMSFGYNPVDIFPECATSLVTAAATPQ